MKRSSELAVLSREHHVALEVALRLQRASENDAEDGEEAALAFWDQEGREHFRIEEQVLLPPFAGMVGQDDPDVVRVLDEHAEITRRMTALGGTEAADVADLRALGELLRDHVRYEERSLFGRIEETLPPAQLAAVGAALEAEGDEHRPPRA